MAMQNLAPAGDFRTTYAADTVLFPTATGRGIALASSRSLSRWLLTARQTDTNAVG